MTSKITLTYPTALALAAISQGHRYGFDIMDATGLTSGTVYPALERLEELSFVRSRWESDVIAHRDRRPARRYFELTRAGSRALAEGLERYPLLRPRMAER